MKESNKIAKNVTWNTVGSLFYLVCQWLLSVVVVRASDNYADAGILSLAMSVTNIFATIALFNVRNFQVSDSDSEYTNTEYTTHRFLTCVAALVLCTLFVILNGYELYISISIIAYMCVKVVEAYADVLHGIAQNKWRLDIAGKSYIMRGILLIGSFTVMQYTIGNLALSISVMALTNIAVLLVYDLSAIRRIDSFGFKASRGKLLGLTLKCLPLLVYGLCTNSIVSSARYFIEFFHGEQTLGYYATVSAVAVLVQTFVTLIFTPLIGVFNQAYREGNKRAVTKLLVKLALLSVGITALAMLAIRFLGDFAMGLVFGESILPYVYLLYPTVIASCLTAIMWLLGMLLVVMRDMRTLVGGAAVGIILSVALSLILIPGDTPYDGANISIISSLSLICIIYIVRFVAYLLSNNVRPTSEEKE